MKDVIDPFKQTKSIKNDKGRQDRKHLCASHVLLAVGKGAEPRSLGSVKHKDAGYLEGQEATFVACWGFARSFPFINLSALMLLEPMHAPFFSSV